MKNVPGKGTRRWLPLGSPWENWRLARRIGLNWYQTLVLFEEARRENEARDWHFHMLSLLLVLAVVAAGFMVPVRAYAQFSAPGGFLALFLLLFSRTCYHHANALIRYEQRRNWLR